MHDESLLEAVSVAGLRPLQQLRLIGVRAVAVDAVTCARTSYSSP